MSRTYVVFVGRRPGLYFDWHHCSVQVIRYPGAIYKRYDTYEEAERAFLTFWGNLDPDDVSNNEGSSSTQQPAEQQVPNAGVNRDEPQIRHDNLIYLLALVILILSLKVLFS